MSERNRRRGRSVFIASAGFVVFLVLGFVLPRLTTAGEQAPATSEHQAFVRYARHQVPLVFDNPIQQFFIAQVSVEESRQLDYGRCEIPTYGLNEAHDYEAVVRVDWIYWANTERIRVTCDGLDRMAP